MTPQEAAKKLKIKLADLERFRREAVPGIIGDEAVNHYNKSFENEGKTDQSFEKWPDVKRRDPNSKWYGFGYESNDLKPGKKRGEGKSNYSNKRTKDKILKDTAALKDATGYVIKPDRVTIRNDRPYARVHNFGEEAKVFGKKVFRMQARQFIYPSTVLNKEIHNKIMVELQKIKKK